MSDDSGLFGRRTVLLLIAAGALSVAAALVFALAGADVRPVASVGTDSFSRSAIGHRAFVELMRALGHRVLVSRNATGGKLGPEDLLVLLEPDPAHFAERLAGFPSARRVLLVLPKWQGPRDPRKPHWIGHAELKPESAVTGILRDVVSDGRILRAGGAFRPVKGAISAVPTLPAPQLMTHVPLQPVVYSVNGLLVGTIRRRDRDVVIVSDPDIFANFGIVQGDNARFATQLIDWILKGKGAIVIDETVHGFVETPSLLRSLFRFPFLVSTIAAAITLLVLVWATARRFGAPAPEAPALEGGKAALVDNTASLLTHGGHHLAIVDRYTQTMRQEVARRLHAPVDGDGEDTVIWLDRVGRARGVGQPFSKLLVELADLRSTGRPGAPVRANAMRAARHVNQWKREMLDGGAGNTRHQQPG